MGNKQDWKLDVPTDPNKVASYSSSEIKQGVSENMSRDDFFESLKKVSRKTTPSEHDSSKSRT